LPVAPFKEYSFGGSGVQKVTAWREVAYLSSLEKTVKEIKDG
jgi:hypothetical protein